MLAIWNFIFRRLPVVRLLDGKKTTIGAALTIAAGVMDILAKLAVMFPDKAWISDLAGALNMGLVDINEVLKGLGLGFMAVGLADKAAKTVK